MDQKNEEAGKKENEPVTYYGKKAYRVHPGLARVQPFEKRLPDYRDENLSNRKAV